MQPNLTNNLTNGIEPIIDHSEESKGAMMGINQLKLPSIKHLIKLGVL